jgi:carboxypeptidase C (cathepsin A)
MKGRLAFAATLLCLVSAPGAGQAAPAPGAHASSPAALAPPRRFESEHAGTFGDTHMRYRAIVAEHFITDPAGRRTASIFTTSYIRADAPKDGERPVIFAFNGGPGSSSLWLHMGFVGPKRIAFGNDLKPETAPPFRLADNRESPLDIADLVLIDPPGTGFSRILPDGKPEQFYGVDQDARASVQVIEEWIREHGRWNAPKYLLSESYGTIRAAEVAKLLAGGPMETGRMNGVTLNGVILLGQAMDMSRGGSADDREYANALPTLAATACYFGKGPAGCTAEGQAAAARAFVAQHYVEALYAGSTLPAAERDKIADGLAALTGLSRSFVLDHDLRVDSRAFAMALLAERGKQLGAYDARYTLPLSPNGNDPVADDPAMGQYVTGFVAALNLYMRDQLGTALDIPYEAIAFRTVNAKWDYGYGPGVPVGRNYADDLAVAMRRNPDLRLMVGAGYYDLVTTLGAAEYTVAHSGIPADRTQFHYYQSGHMPYLGETARVALARDVRAFVMAGAR